MRHLFLTGGTGVIGSAILPRLLADPHARVTALLRARSDEHLSARSHELLAFCGIEDAQWRERIDFLSGDACRKAFGVTGPQYDALTKSITGIVHCAGRVKLNQDLEEARLNAYRPTEEILALAHRAERLTKIDCVSTIGVAGRMPGTIAERRLTESRAFHNNYEQAKAEAEELLWIAIDEGLPITIHRPSMVVGDSRNGAVPHYQVFYYLCEFLSGRRTFGVLPTFGEAALDVVPSDYVAEVICRAASDPKSAGKVLHLCAGNLPELRFDALSDSIRDVYRSLGQRCPRKREVSLPTFRRLAQTAARLGPTPLRKAARTLHYFLPYLMQQQRFSVTDTSRYADSLGIRQPRVEDYLPRILAPYLEGVSNSLPAPEQITRRSNTGNDEMRDTPPLERSVS